MCRSSRGPIGNAAALYSFCGTGAQEQGEREVCAAISGSSVFGSRVGALDDSETTSPMKCLTVEEDAKPLGDLEDSVSLQVQGTDEAVVADSGGPTIPPRQPLAG